MPEPQKRRNRFKRKPIGQIDFIRSPYYGAMIHYVWRYGMLTIGQVAALTETSVYSTRPRLRKLFDHEFLDRLYQPVILGEGSKPDVYVLGKAGKKYLTEYYGYQFARRKLVSNKARYIQHNLMISDIISAFDLACREIDNLEMLWPEDILAKSPEKTRAMKYPFNLKTELRDEKNHKFSYNLTPDKVFGLERVIAGESKRVLFFLEADRSTESVNAKRLNKSSIRKKVLGYQDIYLRKLQQERYGFGNFRALFVTKTKERKDSILLYLRDVHKDSKGLGVFNLAALADLIAGENILTDEIWERVKVEENVSLLK